VAGDVARRLSHLGFQPLLAFDGTQVLRIARHEQRLAAVVVDSTMLRGESISFLEDLRVATSSPVIVLQPGALAEIGTVESVLTALQPSPSTVMSWDGIELEPRTHEAHLDGTPIYLTPFEYRILETLVAAAGALVRKEELEREVWGTPTVDDGERLATHVRRIRHKIEPDPPHPALLLTVRGLGYRLGKRPAVLDLNAANPFRRRTFVG
jgi:DNA-binding response OmpR family regulator